MDIEKIYDTGHQAFERGNFEYAIEMFKRIITLSPEHVKARKALRATERKLAGQPSKGLAGALAGLGLAFAGNLKKNARKIMERCEDILVKDPWNRPALMKLGEAALAGEFPETAVATFEDLLSINNKDIKVLKMLGRAYKLKEDYENAIKCFQKIMKEKPSDVEAKEEVKNLAASQSLSEKWGQEDRFTGKLRDEEEARELAGDRVIRTAGDLVKAIQATKDLLARSPKEIKLLLKMGDLCRQKGDMAEAKRYFEMALAVDPNNYTSRVKIADIDIAALEQALEAAKVRFEADPKDPEARKEYEKTRKEKLLYEIREYERRIKAQPTDMTLRYKVGLLYFEGGLLDQAIGNFQRAKNDPKIRNRVQIIMGRAFIKKGQHDLAIAQLGELIEGRMIMDEDKKEALYNRADAFKGLNRYAEARKDLEAIYLEDIGFRDVAQRIKELDDLMKRAGSEQQTG